MPINIPGFPLSQKTPKIYVAIILGGPGTNAGVAPMSMIVYGNMIQSAITGSSPTFTVAAGTSSLAQPSQIFDAASAGGLYGRGSELHLGLKSALKQYPSATLWGIAVAKPSGSPVAASSVLSVEVSSATNTAVTLNVWAGGRQYQYNAGAGPTETASTIALGIAQQILNDGDAPVYAQVGANALAAVVTITYKNPGARGNNTPVRAQLVSGSQTLNVNGTSGYAALNGVAVILSTPTNVLTLNDTTSTTTSLVTQTNPSTLGVTVGSCLTVWDPAGITTTVAAGSNGQTSNALTSNILSVASTAGFPSAGSIVVVTSSGPTVIFYTGTSGGNSFTGCSGGSAGTVATSGVVGANTYTQTFATVVANATHGPITVSPALTTTPASTSTIVYWTNPNGQTARMYGGTGTDDLTNALAATSATLYNRQVFAQNDQTNFTSALTQLNGMAAVLTGIWQQGTVASLDTYATAVAFSTAVGLSGASRMQIAWQYNGEYSPTEIAAGVMAARLIGDGSFGGAVIGEATNVAGNLNGVTLGGIPVQPFIGDRPSATQIENALNHGLSPLQPSNLAPGMTSLVASITARWQDLSLLPNYAVYDTKTVTVSDAIAYDLRQDLAITYAGYNLAPDPAGGAPLAIPLTTTPGIIKGRIVFKLKSYEAQGWIIDVDALLPQLAVMIDTTNPSRVLADVPEVPIPNLSQIAFNLRQQSPL